MNQQRQWTRRIAFLAAILLTLAVAAFSAGDFVELIRAEAWPTTTGRVFSSRVIAKGRAGSRFSPGRTVSTFEQTIQYTVGGQTYAKTVRTIHPNRDETSIAYNPRKPSEIWMGARSPDVLEMFLLGAAIIGLIVTASRWAKYESGRRQDHAPE